MYACQAYILRSFGSQGVTKRFGTGPDAVTAIQGLDLEVAKGEFLTIVGASGLREEHPPVDRGRPDQADLRHRRRPGRTRRPDVPGRHPDAVADRRPQRGPRPAPARASRAPSDRPGSASCCRSCTSTAARTSARTSCPGGMRQRVALARVLAQEADLVLMDEPFGALDAMTRDAMHDELERLWSEHGLTVLFVTHNVREAVRLGDRVVLLASSPGRVKAELPVPLRTTQADRLPRDRGTRRRPDGRAAAGGASSCRLTWDCGSSRRRTS